MVHLSLAADETCFIHIYSDSERLKYTDSTVAIRVRITLSPGCLAGVEMTVLDPVALLGLLFKQTRGNINPHNEANAWNRGFG